MTKYIELVRVALLLTGCIQGISNIDESNEAADWTMDVPIKHINQVQFDIKLLHI